MALRLSSTPETQSHQSAFLAPLRPLAEKNFGIFWCGAFLSSLGFWIQNVGQGWQVYQLTNSALLLGLVAFAGTVPSLVLSLFGGVIVDRMNRRHLLLMTQTIYMMTSLLLGILTTLHVIAVWHIIVLALINGIFNSVGQPAWQTFIGDLVPPKHLKEGIALNSMQFNLSRVIGPALGGFSVGLLGIAGSYYLNSLSYVAVIVPLVLMHTSQLQRAASDKGASGQGHTEQTEQKKQGIWQGLWEGIQYLLHHPALQLTLLLQLIIAFCIFPYTTLLPIFAGDIFHIGAQGLGELNAAAGIGAFMGSILVVMLSHRMQHGSGPLKLLCFIGGSTCIAFALAAKLDLALMILLVLGASTVMSTTITNTAVQILVPLEMRGRVLSIWVMITFGIAPFGNLFSGWIAQSIGAPATLLIAGGICASSALLIAAIQFQQKLRVKAKLA